MKAELHDSLEPLFPDSAVSPRPCQTMELDVARGATVAVHLLATDLAEGTVVRAAVGKGGGPVREARWFRLVDVPVEANTGAVNFTERGGRINTHAIRRAPFRVFDAMQPITGPAKAPACGTMALRLHIPIARTARPGRHVYQIGLAGGSETRQFTLAVRVHRATIPAPGRGSLVYTNWFNFGNIASRHGLALWSEPYWRMLRRYADLMVRSRQNTFLIPWSAVFVRTANGLALDRPRLRRIVRTFSAAGMHWIEGGHVASRTGDEWRATTFDLNLCPGVRATSPEGNELLAGALRQLVDEIARNGWGDRWVQHVADEPIADNAADYRILCGMVRRHMPGAVIVDATLNPALAGSIDIWCPVIQEYQADRARFRRQQAIGDRVWCYTCCQPGGPWMNRLLDEELLRPALIGWAIGLFRLDGFLHWGLNQYRKGQDPFSQSVVPHQDDMHLPAGDTHVVYPGPDGPWSSLRLESHREGFEDLEMLRALQGRDAKRADRITRMAVRGFDRYVRDARRFRAARRALLDAVDSIDR